MTLPKQTTHTDRWRKMMEPATLINKPMQRHFYRPVPVYTWAHFGESKTMGSHVNMSTSCRHVNISPCLWLQLVTEVPVRIWICAKFKLKIDRSVKTGISGSCRLQVKSSCDRWYASLLKIDTYKFKYELAILESLLTAMTDLVYKFACRTISMVC